MLPGFRGLGTWRTTMGKKSGKKSGVDRRSFLAGIATAGAAAVAVKPGAS